MKNKKNPSQFPNIYRLITESTILKKLKKLEFRLIWQSKHKKYVFYSLTGFSVFLTIILILGILLMGVNFYKTASEYKKVASERKNIQEKINFWQSIANKYEGYKDSYFQIALLEYRLGNTNKAREYNKKALLLDPNFEDSKKLQLLLEE
jgi:tetratricopeptide (TPR) repeat protein